MHRGPDRVRRRVPADGGNIMNERDKMLMLISIMESDLGQIRNQISSAEQTKNAYDFISARNGVRNVEESLATIKEAIRKGLEDG